MADGRRLSPDNLKTCRGKDEADSENVPTLKRVCSRIFIIDHAGQSWDGNGLLSQVQVLLKLYILRLQTIITL